MVLLRSRRRPRAINLFGASLAGQAARAALRGLDPRLLITNPVLLVIEVAAVLTTMLLLRSLLVADFSSRRSRVRSPLGLAHYFPGKLR
jgi:high-affinity K+ transport system ATPase subunit B